MAVARLSTFTAKHDADQTRVAASNGCDKVEAGGPNIAGLDSVSAVVSLQQIVVVTVGPTAMGEF